MKRDQAAINAQWEQTIPANKGFPSLTLLIPPKRETPPGLRKPYQFKATRAMCNQLVTQLKKYCRENEKFGQYVCVEKKSLAFGIRLHLFVLCNAPGLLETNEGCTKEQWAALIDGLDNLLYVGIGEPPAIYAEPWAPDRKFQARYETYIQFSD